MREFPHPASASAFGIDAPARSTCIAADGNVEQLYRFVVR